MKIAKNYSPAGADLAVLDEKFHSYVLSRIPDLPDESKDRKFLFSIFDKDDLVAGICGKVYWNGLEIDILWVDETYRGSGYGKRLLQEAERYAISEDAVVSFLKTVEASGFYEKMGYQVYGVLEDRPIGTVLYHMKKRLDR